MKIKTDYPKTVAAATAVETSLWDLGDALVAEVELDIDGTVKWGELAKAHEAILAGTGKTYSKSRLSAMRKVAATFDTGVRDLYPSLTFDHFKEAMAAPDGDLMDHLEWASTTEASSEDLRQRIKDAAAGYAAEGAEAPADMDVERIEKIIEANPEAAGYILGKRKWENLSDGGSDPLNDGYDRGRKDAVEASRRAREEAERAEAEAAGEEYEPYEAPAPPHGGGLAGVLGSILELIVIDKAPDTLEDLDRKLKKVADHLKRGHTHYDAAEFEAIGDRARAAKKVLARIAKRLDDIAASADAGKAVKSAFDAD